MKIKLKLFLEIATFPLENDGSNICGAKFVTYILVLPIAVSTSR